MSSGGEVFILDMGKQMKVLDLAQSLFTCLVEVFQKIQIQKELRF